MATAIVRGSFMFDPLNQTAEPMSRAWVPYSRTAGKEAYSELSEIIFSSPGRRPGRVIVLPPALASALAKC